MHVLDPVCGMKFEVEEAAGESTYEGETYYFCGTGCKRAFDEDPERFVDEPGDEDSPKSG